MKKIRKVELDILLNILTDLYESGVDYVDISGRYDEERNVDIINITVEPEYMASDESVSDDSFSDEDINDLI